jgi:hypothetical protein
MQKLSKWTTGEEKRRTGFRLLAGWLLCVCVAGTPVVAAAIDVSGEWDASATLPGTCQWIGSLTMSQTGTTFTGGGTFILQSGDVACPGAFQGTLSGTLSGNTITFGLWSDLSGSASFTGTVNADGQSSAGVWWTDTFDGTWALLKRSAPCPPPPVPTCTEEDPCVSLRQRDVCPDGATMSVDTTTVEPAQTHFCPGDQLGVIRVHQGTFVETVTDEDFECHEDCTRRCGDRCIAIPISGCWQICLRRCSNGLCLEWETQCGVTGTQTDCTTYCFNQCFANFEPVTRTNYFESPCGFAIDEPVEIRSSDGACTGALVTGRQLVGAGSAAANVTLPLTPGDYDVCSNGALVQTITVDPCVQPACAVVVPQNVWSLRQGVDASLPVTLASNAAAGGSYSISLLRFEDDAHTVDMALPPFITAPESLTVAAGGSLDFDLVATDPQPVGRQVQWPGVIIRAVGPATCEATLTPEMTCSVDTDCDDGNPCTVNRCAPTDRHVTTEIPLRFRTHVGLECARGRLRHCAWDARASTRGKRESRFPSPP